MKVVLASASPRRKELLKEVFPAFEILPAKGEEKAEETLDPKELVVALARQKAEEVFSSLSDKDHLVLGADTVVSYGGKVLGKPKDEQEAKAMLTALSGNKHEVLTGVCFCFFDKDGTRKTITAYDRTEVEFYPLSPAFIERYVQSGSPMDKAGAYGIQDGGLVKEIHGSYSNVVGLPVELCQKIKAQIFESNEVYYD